jgi:xanthine dehydrogenase accessory factor
LTGAADHRRILEQARAWSGARLALATVVATWRSAPCPIGTHMLVHGDERFIGSVSGGCVEGDVLIAAGEVIASGAHQLRRYGVADGAAWEVGLPCGGDIQVLIQPVATQGFPLSLFVAIDEAQSRGHTLVISTDLMTGESTLAAASNENIFRNAYAPSKRLLIIGAVEIATSLSAIARQLGFAVTVIDPRERFLTAERFPGVVRDDRWPDEAVKALAPDSRTAIVTLSHDIKIDDPALFSALQSEAGYIAALGSRASHAARLKRLEAHGFSAEALKRIEGPAGVTINAISAPEIALSIASGMIRAFNEGLR